MTAPGEPTSLYVHVPFCVRKCAYCDFYSVESPDCTRRRRYLKALDAEATGPRRAMRTVYVGGGTPTVLRADELARLFEVLGRRFDLVAAQEMTVEANPGTIDDSRSRVLLAYGVTRVSLGVQSFQQETLRILGRVHSTADTRRAVDLLRASGLKNLSLDLIFGVPGQSLDAWLDDLRQASSLSPEHLSVYGLSIPAGSRLAADVAAGRLEPVSDDLYARMLSAARDELLAAGFEHYEISNYCRPGRRCRHNMAYWRNEPYIGLGPAAASYVSGRRSTNVADLGAWAEGVLAGRSAAAHTEALDSESRARETAMLALRTADGLVVEAFRSQTGFDPLELFADAVERHRSAGFLEVTPGPGATIRLTPAALPVADSVLADFVG